MCCQGVAGEPGRPGLPGLDGLPGMKGETAVEREREIFLKSCRDGYSSSRVLSIIPGCLTVVRFTKGKGGI